MKTNTSYRQTIRRHNYLTAAILVFFDKWSSSPRLMLEVFVRKNFGQYYFNMGSVLKVAIILSLLPLGLYRLLYNPVARQFTVSFWELYLSWYLFVAAFLIVSVFRWIETKRLSNDIEYPLNHPGQINPLFFDIKFFGKPPSDKLITVVYEPVFFFIVGKMLSYTGQQIGVLIMLNSVFYSLGTYAEYWFAKQEIDQAKFDIQQGEMRRKIHEEKEMGLVIKNNQRPTSGNSNSRNEDDKTTLAL